MAITKTLSLARNAAKSAVVNFSPGTIARLEWASGRGQRKWGGAMNGQHARMRMVRQLVSALPVRAVIETGTFRGATTEFLAHVTGVHVYTVELSRRYYEFSKIRFGGDPFIHQYLGDSREFLRSSAADPSLPKEHVLFYLDAHWEKDLPLREELSLIRRWWSNAICIIDDFEVPGDPMYQFDDYGPDQRLTLDYLPPEAIGDKAIFAPSVPATEEDGRRRGCVVVVDQSRAEVVEEHCELRRVL